MLFIVALAQTQESPPHPSHTGPSAVIVDQLSATDPNRTFVERVTGIMERAGYVIDHYSEDEVDVHLYQRLTRLGYDIIVLRTHSSATDLRGSNADVALFTNEAYDRRKHLDAWGRQLPGAMRYDEARFIRDPTYYFGVHPRFFKQVGGDLDGAVVIAMGCKGMANDTLADTFLHMGASAYVGWDDSVTADRTDAATLRVLEAWLDQGMDLTAAVGAAMESVGEDHAYGSRLGIRTAEEAAA